MTSGGGFTPFFCFFLVLVVVVWVSAEGLAGGRFSSPYFSVSCGCFFGIVGLVGVLVRANLDEPALYFHPRSVLSTVKSCLDRGGHSFCFTSFFSCC